MQALNAVVTALLYVAWHVFALEGADAVPDPINESGEENIRMAMEYADSSVPFPDNFLFDLFDRIEAAIVQAVGNSTAESSDRLGPPIPRAVVAEIVKRNFVA